ncbi:hypothetical protein PI125_g3173 [Phytophthora idaei]|nr:hypothetical protein PI125_g3173 [Phytophthora idaei]
MGESGKRHHAGVQTPESKRLRRTRSGADPTSARSNTAGLTEFKAAWTILRKYGWKPKRPSIRALDQRYLYIKPGGNHTGIEGQDYLRGEDAVVRYVQKEKDMASQGALDASMGALVMSSSGARTGERVEKLCDAKTGKLAIGSERV